MITGNQTFSVVIALNFDRNLRGKKWEQEQLARWCSKFYSKQHSKRMRRNNRLSQEMGYMESSKPKAINVLKDLIREYNWDGVSYLMPSMLSYRRVSEFIKSSDMRMFNSAMFDRIMINVNETRSDNGTRHIEECLFQPQKSLIFTLSKEDAQLFDLLYSHDDLIRQSNWL